MLDHSKNEAQQLAHGNRVSETTPILFFNVSMTSISVKTPKPLTFRASITRVRVVSNLRIFINHRIIR